MKTQTKKIYQNDVYENINVLSDPTFYSIQKKTKTKLWMLNEHII